MRFYSFPALAPLYPPRPFLAPPGEKGSQETVPGDVIPVKQKVVEFKLGDINEFVTVRYTR